MTPKARAILTKTRSLVRRGWCQEAYSDVVDGVTCFCLRGAFTEAVAACTGSRSWDVDAWAAYRLLNEAAMFQGSNGPVSYNDAEGRTQHDVIRLLDGILETP